MSTPVEKVPQEPNPNPITQESGTTPISEPVSQPQAAPATDQRFSSLEDIIRQQNERINQLIELANKKPEPAPKPPVDPEKQKADFFNRPHETVEQIVKKELREAIAPLQEFVHSFRNENAYEAMKKQFKLDPRFSQHWDSALETAVDQVMLSGRVEVNRDNMQAAIVQAIGLKGLGMLPGATINNNQPVSQSAQPNNNMINPPHLRPSAPPAPVSDARQPKRQLTENERRIARENHQTDEEYLAWLEVGPGEIAGSKIGRKQ